MPGTTAQRRSCSYLTGAVRTEVRRWWEDHVVDFTLSSEAQISRFAPYLEGRWRSNGETVLSCGPLALQSGAEPAVYYKSIHLVRNVGGGDKAAWLCT